MNTSRSLDVFRENEMVGTLIDTTPMTFVYSDTWLSYEHAEPIVPYLHLQKKEHQGDHVDAYFENLLPEANLRDLLKLRYQVSTTFGLLNAIGGDTASALSLYPTGERPKLAEYHETTWEKIGEILGTDPQDLAYPEHHDGIRISLAGAQRKMAILIRDDGTPALPMGSAPSSHIIKPEIKGIDGVWSSAINETFIMTLASTMKLGVAEVFYQPAIKACVIKRYDRIKINDTSLKRIHQLDLCQLDRKPSSIKYESDGGPSLLRCKDILVQNGVPASDLKRLIQWITYNLIVGNYDSHAKNISIVYHSHGDIRLAPFYDMLCTGIYSGLSRSFAFRIGGTNVPADIDLSKLRGMADELGFKPEYITKIVATTLKDAKKNLNQVAEKLKTVTNIGAERTMVERLSLFIQSNIDKYASRWEMTI